MTLEQILLIGLLITLFGIFALDRFRIEAVAVAGLMAAFAIGLVPASSVFSGLAHPAVITVAEILILVGALQASHLLDRAAEFLTVRIKSSQLLFLLLCSIAGSVSVFMNNIGALALMIPLVTAVSERSGIPLSRLLMPISFATLLGGTCSLIGTPANLIVSDVLLAETGKGLGFFEFAKVGLPALIIGLAAIVLFVPRLLPANFPATLNHKARRRLVIA
jgi:Na+/H+ antiporter NhaD/arsenite permease-like protein